MSAWDNIVRSVRIVRLDTMRTKFVVFTVGATLLSTLIMTLVLYGWNKRTVSERVGNELGSMSSEAARQVGAWIDQRVYDLRLRAAPYVVSDNLARTAGRAGAQSISRLHDYVGSIRQNLPGHDGLAILDVDGQLLTSAGSRSGFRLTSDRLNTLRTRDALVGDAFWDASTNKAAIVLVVPIRRDDGVFLGALAAKVNLDGVRDTLKQLIGNTSRNVYIITEEGRVVISSAGSSAEIMKTVLPATATRDLTDHEGQVIEQTRFDGRHVLALQRPIPQLRWASVAEAPRDETAREIGALRSKTLLLFVPLLGGVAILAFGVGVLLMRPLEQVTDAAARVAAGDLSAEFPAGASGEVGYLTRAFNTVVARLREKESQGELEKLSFTDALTGLYNRRHLMGTLATEIQRSRRQRRAFTVLIADVDKFKQYNDTHGHLAGDAALVKIAEVFRRTTRGVDCVARYGGEEFVVMLLECPIATGALVAERIRARVAEQELGEAKLTVSIGLAEYPDGGDSPEELIATADAAMYRAKSSGRNQVVVGGVVQEHVPERRARRKREA